MTEDEHKDVLDAMACELTQLCHRSGVGTILKAFAWQIAVVISQIVDNDTRADAKRDFMRMVEDGVEVLVENDEDGHLMLN